MAPGPLRRAWVIAARSMTMTSPVAASGVRIGAMRGRDQAEGCGEFGDADETDGAGGDVVHPRQLFDEVSAGLGGFS